MRYRKRPGGTDFASVPLQQVIIIFGLGDHWHPIADRGHNLIGRRCQDREGFQRLRFH
jgi:hypothetical protein